MAAPASIAAKRAQVAQIQRDLEAIDAKVGLAAEAYNGAQWRLGVVQDRIRVNRRNLAEAARSLKTARTTLVRRVRQIYKQGRPTTAEVLMSGGGVVALVDQAQMLKRVEHQDAHLVVSIRDYRARAQKARVGLIKDRGAAQHQVANARESKIRVEALLRRRQAVLAHARGDLGRMLAAERARERQQAEIARQRALAAQAAPATRVSSAGATPGETPTAPLPSGDGNAAAVRIAMQYLGVPYVWGGASPSGFDCSGLASYAYAQIGKSVPHYTGAIWAQFPKVPSDQLQPGDLVFFHSLGHMGIYIGGGQMVHAPHTGDVVRVASVSGHGGYVGAVRP